MTWDREYRAKVEAARDAILDLLNTSSAESWITLRMEYRGLMRELERDRPAEKVSELHDPALSGHHAACRAAWDRQQECWRSLSGERRESLVLDLIGRHSLTVREIAEAITEKFRTPECGDVSVVRDNEIRPVVARMFHSRQLNREAEVFRGKQTRYRYTRRCTLDGPIADLERAFHE